MNPTTVVPITWTTNGLTLATGSGPSPAPTPKDLLATRAIESKKGWLGQIVMAGDIVFQTKPKKSSRAALTEVNRYFLDRIRSLIIGGAA